MPDEKPKREYTSMQVPTEVAELCKAYSQLAELQDPTKKTTLKDAFEKIYHPTIDQQKIQEASAELAKIRKDGIKASKEVLKGIEL